MGQVGILPFERANKENTVEVLKRLGVEFPDVPIKLIWDRVPYHGAQVVQEAAQTLDIGLVRLPVILCPWNIYGTGCGRTSLTIPVMTKSPISSPKLIAFKHKPMPTRLLSLTGCGSNLTSSLRRKNSGSQPK